MEIQDQLGRKIGLKKTPKKIISLVPSQTELLVDLGLQDSIVGITHYCVHPAVLKEIKTSVGGTKKVNFRKVRELEPDIILCNKEENTREMVEELEKIAPVHVSDVATLEDAFNLMLDYGRILNCSQLASTMVSSIRKKSESLGKLVTNSSEKRVAYFIWNNPLMVAGKGTFIDEILKLNGFQNVFSEERYPETSIEELKDKNIDICLLSSEPFPFSEEHKALFKYVAREIKIVDGEYFSWYGSRLLEAMDYFKQFHS
ncbi:ABC-type Fe3+-hydroxamate transport system substrate-binding protein [Christiangramia gaetbulicola]|uniref:ABC-type Fe3+-hydroxamate transport system substrate-binding protein n=1 Tax=Christiangramia gaetbulicola TaxID=703340 RepID=A0A2T6AJZ8_9FLAO|nr:helical backbone metal receptor [Christiangramia gaetbulicola]PTX44153.1 ABC-type Fe3+-hydroxamate transport system substrate-binding protein [Christiangramia gaetbulicola]